MTTQQRDVFWQQQIASWLSSRLSAPAFCKLHDLSYHQFSYWRRKLATPQLVSIHQDGVDGISSAGMG